MEGREGERGREGETAEERVYVQHLYEENITV